MINKELSKAKKCYIKKHPLGCLTVKQLKIKATMESVFIHGDKAQILQCFDQVEQMSKLFTLVKK